MTERHRSGTDTPLFAWGNELRARAAHRRRLRSRAALIGLGGLLLAATIAWPPRPRILWNASASAPIGLYAIAPPTLLRTGDMVIAQVPAPARNLAATRRYIPVNVPLVKRVAATRGDTICAFGPELFINGRWVAERRKYDGRGRTMPIWNGCMTLRDGAVLLLMDSPDSFDGRYFGPTGPQDIIGKARLLWRR